MARTQWLKIETFDDILDSFKIGEPDDSQQFVSIPIHQLPHVPAVELWLPSEYEPKLSSLRKVIRRGLEELDHLVSDRLVDSLLPLFPITPAQGREKLEWLFSRIRMTDITQTLVLPFELEVPLEHEIRLKEFVIKPFRAAPKMDSAFAANSPLIIDPAVLQTREGRLCIERVLKARPVCDPMPYESFLDGIGSKLAAGDVWEDGGAAIMVGTLFFENYGDAYRWLLQDEFQRDFRDAQASHVALGGKFFPIDEVRRLDDCLFLDEWHDVDFNKSRGVMVPHVNVQAHAYDVSRAFEEFLSTYRAWEDFISVKAPSDRAVESFARVVLMAREQAQEQRIEIAFLLCFTALETLLVGPDEPITRTLARRLGAVVSLSQNSDFPGVSSEIYGLYDKRSKFTHQAIKVGPEALNRLFNLCQHAYITAVGASIVRAALALEGLPKWHKLLDYLAAALDAGVQVDSSVALKAGIHLTPPQESRPM